jgi:hypothetical protein
MLALVPLIVKKEGVHFLDNIVLQAYVENNKQTVSTVVTATDNVLAAHWNMGLGGATTPPSQPVADGSAVR